MFRWMGTKEGLRNIDDGYEGSLTSSVGSKRGMMSEGAAGERDTANGPPARKRPHLCYNPALAKVGHQEIEAAKLEIAPEDDPNPLGLVLATDGISNAHAERDKGVGAVMSQRSELRQLTMKLVGKPDAGNRHVCHQEFKNPQSVKPTEILSIFCSSKLLQDNAAKGRNGRCATLTAIAWNGSLGARPAGRADVMPRLRPTPRRGSRARGRRIRAHRQVFR
jgi:hypothetical protein